MIEASSIRLCTAHNGRFLPLSALFTLCLIGHNDTRPASIGKGILRPLPLGAKETMCGKCTSSGQQSPQSYRAQWDFAHAQRRPKTDAALHGSLFFHLSTALYSLPCKKKNVCFPSIDML
jgi:hypothetical protein